MSMYVEVVLWVCMQQWYCGRVCSSGVVVVYVAVCCGCACGSGVVGVYVAVVLLSFM